MIRFLSAEWIDAVDAAVDGAGIDPPEGDPPVDGSALVLQQHVSGGSSGGPISYHIVVGTDGVRVRPGVVDEPTVSFSQDYATAAAISQGQQSAQAAFMAGRLRLGGDVAALLAHHELLSRLTDAFADVRARTLYEPTAEAET